MGVQEPSTSFIQDEESFVPDSDAAVTNDEMPQGLSESLQTIDAALAKRNIPMAERPLAAIEILLSLGVLADEQGNPLSKKPSEVVGSEWFAPLLKITRNWYRDQYGAAARSGTAEPLQGFVLIRDTPFMLRVPSQIIRPGEQPGTIWLHLVDRVLADEDPLTWVTTLPQESDDTIRRGWKNAAETTAADLRFIQNRVMSVPSGTNTEILELARTILPHLEQAAQLVLTHKSGEVTRSYWELQMAAEAAFKSVLLQRTGAYPHTHDLAKLSDEIRKFEPSFSVPCLSAFPGWKKAADMRYGVGDAPSWEDSHRDYRCILQTICACATLWQIPMNLSNAEFLLKGIS
jgi:hypothetical protein